VASAVVVASPGNTAGLPGLMVLDGQTGQPILTPAIPQSSFTMWDGSVINAIRVLGRRWSTRTARSTCSMNSGWFPARRASTTPASTC
jgi:hypothetical protein